MRNSRIPSPVTADDIVFARINDLKGTITTSIQQSEDITAGEGQRRYFTPGWQYSHIQSANQLTAIVDQVRCFRFTLLKFAEALFLSAFGVVGGAGPTTVFGLYAADGNELLCQWSIPVASYGASGVGSGELDDSVELSPDDYWLAWSCDSTVPFLAMNGPSLAFAACLNHAQARLGTAANPMVALELPEALGVVTGANIPVPVVCIDGEVG